MISKPFSQWPVFDETEIRNVEAAIRSGIWGVGGKQIPEFAKQFAAFQHAKHALPVANGSLAIDLALEALDIRAGDEVIVPDYTFMATAVAPLRRGITPVLVDVDPETFNLDPDLTEAAITAKTRAIIPVHFGGHPCDMARVMEIAERHGLFVIEDCAHAHGARLEDRYVGTFGSIGTFSFQSSKTLCCGEGGAVVTNSARLYSLLRSLHNAGRHGCEDDYNHFICGTNYRMTELQAALLLAQMARLEAFCNKRNESGARLNELLDEIDGVRPQVRRENLGRHGYYLYTFVLEADIPTKAFTSALQAEGVPVEDSYPALHSLDCLRKKGLGEGHFPVSQLLAERLVWITHHALLGEPPQIALIAEAIKKVLQQLG